MTRFGENTDLDCGGGYTTVYICQNVYNCIQKVLDFPAYELYLNKLLAY